MDANFVYNGDGQRVKSTINNVTTYFVGNYYEVSGGVISKNYSIGGARIAIRQGGVLYYPLADHLGSTTVTTDTAGTVVSELRYDPWGETRFSSGSTPTQYQFTGQYSNSYINLLDYGSRYYDPALGRFISPDSIVPLATQGTQAYDRYAYANNNAVRYSDPSGHMVKEDADGTGCVSGDLACQMGSNGYKVEKISGWQVQVTVTVGIPTNTYANGQKVSPVLLEGISFVFDKYWGFQIYSVTRDIEFSPTLKNGPAEAAFPTEIITGGITVASGPIFGKGFEVEGTNAYIGRSIDNQISGGPISIDSYEAFNANTGKTDSAWMHGFDLGYSAGLPMGFGRIAANSQPLFGMPRIGFPIP